VWEPKLRGLLTHAEYVLNYPHLIEFMLTHYATDLDDPKLLTANVKCIQCQAECTIEPPAIADAIRVGEEGLEKAQALQFDSKQVQPHCRSGPLSIILR
jgi:hypothetical protein